MKKLIGSLQKGIDILTSFDFDKEASFCPGNLQAVTPPPEHHLQIPGNIEGKWILGKKPGDEEL